MATNVLFKKGSASSYETLKSNNTLDEYTFYYTFKDETHEEALYLGDMKLSNEAEVEGALSRLQSAEGNIAAITAQLSTLTGSGDGSISSMIASVVGTGYGSQTVKEYIDSKDSVTTATIEDLKSDIEDSKYDDTALSNRVTSLESFKASFLNGTTSDNLITAINTELTKQLIPENAKESLDTLEEIAAWIQAHPDSVVAMSGNIATNTANIADLTSTIGTLPDGYETLIAYINAKATGGATINALEWEDF